MRLRSRGSAERKDGAQRKDGTASNKRVANNLVALSSAAVLAVYTAGYLRTRSAAERFTVAAAERRIAAPSSTPAADARSVETASAIPAPPSGTSVAHSVPSTGATSAGPSSAPIALPEAGREPVPADAATPPGGDFPAPVPATSPTPPTETLPVAIAEGAVQIPEPVAPPAQGQYKDGTYLGWGYSRHGDIQASVVVEDGRVVSAEIAQCRTRYSCSWIEQLPQQILSRQKASVDFVSGATQSSYAFEDAVGEALAKAK